MTEDRAARRRLSATSGSPAEPKPKLLVTKVPRVPRACDNCRLRKSKCDGRIPCSFCTSHEFECVYDASRPKRRLDSKYIQSLERDIARLKQALEAAKAKAAEEPYPSPLTSISNADGHIQQSGRSPSNATPSDSAPGSQAESIQEPRMLLETMVEATGSLDIDESGNCDYNGNSAGLIMIRRIRERCDALLEGSFNPSTPSKSTAYHSLTTPIGSPGDVSESRSRPALPARDVAIEHVRRVVDHVFPLLHFLHMPTFSDRFERFYALRINPDFEDARFEALLYEIFALGELFSPRSQQEIQLGQTPSLSQLYFRAGQDLVNITDVCDLTSLQALLCMIMYLQSSGMIPTCYSYISLGVAACTRMGLHRADTSDRFNMVDREVRKRIFWTMRTMETYVMTILGLPRILSDEDIDQEFPEEIDDQYITEAGLLPIDQTVVSSMTVVNAHTKLLIIMAKVKKFVLGRGKGGPGEDKGLYRVDYSRIVEIENELELWFSKLPKDTDFPQPIPVNVIRTQFLLRSVYAHVQMVLYRPFLHHIAKSPTDNDFDLRAFACASACINAAMQIVWLDEALDSKNLMDVPSWFLLYITLQATICLLMFVLSNCGDDTAQECLNGARRGYAILSKFSNLNRIAQDYVETLGPLFEKISLAQNSNSQAPPPQMQRNQLNRDTPETNDRLLFNDMFLVSPPIPSTTATARVSHEFDEQLESHLQAMAYTPNYPFEHYTGDYPGTDATVANHRLF